MEFPREIEGKISLHMFNLPGIASPEDRIKSAGSGGRTCHCHAPGVVLFVVLIVMGMTGGLSQPSYAVGGRGRVDAVDSLVGEGEEETDHSTAAQASDTVAAEAWPTDTVATVVQSADTAAAEAEEADTVAADTTATGGAEKIAGKEIGRISPVWTTTMRANDVNVSLISRMETSYLHSSGWDFTNTVDIQKTIQRGRDRQQINKNLSNTAKKIAPDNYSFELMIGESFSKSQSAGLARYGKDLIRDKQRAAAELVLERAIIEPVNSEFSVRADLEQGRDDFKYDRTYKGGAEGLLGYDLGDNLSVRSSYGWKGSKESSEVGDVVFGGMPSWSGDFRSSMTYGEGRNKLIDFKYQKTDGMERKVDPPRGNSLEILDDPSKATREEIVNELEKIDVSTFTQPFPFLSVQVKFRKSLNSKRYKVDQRMSRSRESTQLTANVTYKYSDGGSASFSITNSEEVNEKGRGSLSSYREEGKELSAGLNHNFSSTTSFSLAGSAYIKQKYFLIAQANPRDEDRVYYRGNLTFQARPFESIKTTVDATADKYEIISIDASLSGDNRVEYLYLVEPAIELKPRSWVTIRQDYTVRMEYTDYVYTEDENYLQRTTGLNTFASFRVFEPLSFSFEYTYLLKDKGSYLDNDRGVEVYSPYQENLEDGLAANVNYKMGEDMALRAESKFRLKETNQIGAEGGKFVVTSSRDYESGQLLLGFKKFRQIGEDGKLDLDIAYVRNYGPYISEKRKEYWDVNASLKFEF